MGVAREAKDERAPGVDGGSSVEQGDDTDAGRKSPRIRCPRCAWEPRKDDRWACFCGHAWNTFDTAGRCPECGFQHARTQCLACQEWSAHLAWYAGDPAH